MRKPSMGRKSLMSPITHYSCVQTWGHWCLRTPSQKKSTDMSLRLPGLLTATWCLCFHLIKSRRVKYYECPRSSLHWGERGRKEQGDTIQIKWILGESSLQILTPIFQIRSKWKVSRMDVTPNALKPLIFTFLFIPVKQNKQPNQSCQGRWKTRWLVTEGWSTDNQQAPWTYNWLISTGSTDTEHKRWCVGQ